MPQNTALTYRYEDMAGFKTTHTVVLAGELTADDLDLIESRLDEETYFIPAQVGLEGLQGQMPEASAHYFTPWHIWLDASPSGDPVDAPVSAGELVAAFDALEDWNTAGLEV